MYPNQEVSDLRNAGRTEDAYKKARELLVTHPDDYYLKNSFGWVLYDKVKAIVNRAREDASNAGSAGGAVRRLLLEYARLALPRPDLLFSLLLSQTLRIPVKLDFLPAFLAWAGLESFRPEDYQAQHGQEDDTVFESLIEKAARVNAKAVRGGDEEKLKEFALSLLDKAIAEAEIQSVSWLQYGKALLLGELGRTDDARVLLLPFVREKRAEFWAWHALSKIEEKQNPELALALSAKASLTCSNEKFGLSVYEDVGRLAASAGKGGLARWATDRAVTIRQENGWRIPDSLRTLIESDWYEAAPTLEDPTSELKVCARAADQIVYADCPRYEANFLGEFKAKSGKLMLKVAVKEGGRAVEIVSPAKGLTGVENYRVGDAISVGVLHQEQRSTIIEMKPRTGGAEFDCLDSIYGIVDHQNREKGLVSIYISEDEFCLLPYPQFDSAREWAAGSPVLILCTRSEDRLRPYQAKIVKFQETEWITRISGDISIHQKGFGFVNDVFIPPHLARTFEDGREVSVVAVRKRNKKTNELGWTAVAPVSDVVVEFEKYRKRGY